MPLDQVRRTSRHYGQGEHRAREMMRRDTAPHRRSYHSTPYPNVSIAGEGIRALVFTPDAQRGYYRSSRYDWGSMIGHIQLQVPNSNRRLTLCTDVQPRPHRPQVTDHVLGLAAEFGCGVRGAICALDKRQQTLLATNGIFGYGDAGKGGAFLKLGVGKLARPDNREMRQYNFTWPYRLAGSTAWQMAVTPSDAAMSIPNGVELTHAASHKRWGWKMRRRVATCGAGRRPALCVELALTNTGEHALRTPYASGGAFNLAADPATGPRFAVTFSVPGATRRYDHSTGPLNWSVPLEQIADLRLREHAGQSRIVVKRTLAEHEHASTNFDVTNTTWDGRYAVTLPAAPGWDLVVRHSIWRDATTMRGGWYGFNVRISRRAVSARPYLLLDLKPGETAKLSHQYEFEWRAAR